MGCGQSNEAISGINTTFQRSAESLRRLKERGDEFDELTIEALPSPFVYPRPVRFMYMGPVGECGEVRAVLPDGKLFVIFGTLSGGPVKRTRRSREATAATATKGSALHQHCFYALYNDTTDMEIHVTLTFAKDTSNVRVPKTPSAANTVVGPTLKRLSDGSFEVKVVLPPMATVRVAEVDVVNPDHVVIHCDAATDIAPMTEAVGDAADADARVRLAKEQTRCDERVKSETDAMKAAVQKIVGKGVALDTVPISKMLEICLQSKIQFVDLTFPPLPQSVDPRSDTEAIMDGASKLDPYAFGRPSHYIVDSNHPEETRDLMLDQVRLFRDCGPEDIQQGFLGDCWFLSAIAVLATREEKVKRIFRHPSSPSQGQQERAIGAYTVTLCKNGWWVQYLVDDFLPVSHGHPAFAHHARDPCEIWTCIIEKAFAKAYGFYGQLSSGDSLLALQDLTGYPSIRFAKDWAMVRKDPKGYDSVALIQRLERLHQASALITVNTEGEDVSAYMGGGGQGNDGGKQKEFNDAHLPMGHAFAVLDVKCFNRPDGSFVGLIKIFNPWGNGYEWTGKWSDKDSATWDLNEDCKGACRPQDAADGTFWMQWEDVLKYFESAGASLVKFDWHDYRFRCSIAAPGAEEGLLALHVRVKKTVNAFLLVSQRDERVRKVNAEGMIDEQQEADKDGEYEPVSLSAGRLIYGNYVVGSVVEDVSDGLVSAAVNVQRTGRHLSKFFHKYVLKSGDATAGVSSTPQHTVAAATSMADAAAPQDVAPRLNPTLQDGQWRYVPDKFATLDVEMPGEKLNYNITRDLSMAYQFKPLGLKDDARGTSYFVLPKLYLDGDGRTEALPISLAIIADSVIDDDTFSVEFVRIPFRNFPKQGMEAHTVVFQPPEGDKPGDPPLATTELDFQYTPEVGRSSTGNGSYVFPALSSTGNA